MTTQTAFTRPMLTAIISDLALSTLDFSADNDSPALVADDSIPVPLAQQLCARIEAAGGVASWAPDNDDADLAWVYVTVAEPARVMDYDTSARLDGTASPELIEASEEESSGTGAVCAYQDGAGVWQYVPSSEREHYERNLSETVRTVYVDSQSSLDAHRAKRRGLQHGDIDVFVLDGESAGCLTTPLTAEDGTPIGVRVTLGDGTWRDLTIADAQGLIDALGRDVALARKWAASQ